MTLAEIMAWEGISVQRQGDTVTLSLRMPAGGHSSSSAQPAKAGRKENNKMKLKLYKEVRLDEYHTIRIYGGDEIDIDWAVPDWSEEEEMFFRYQGEEYFLSEFQNIHNEYWNPNPSEWMLEFHGVLSTSYFSGVLIKILEGCDAVQVFTFSCYSNIDKKKVAQKY